MCVQEVWDGTESLRLLINGAIDLGIDSQPLVKSVRNNTIFAALIFFSRLDNCRCANEIFIRFISYLIFSNDIHLVVAGGLGHAGCCGKSKGKSRKIAYFFQRKFLYC